MFRYIDKSNGRYLNSRDLIKDIQSIEHALIDEGHINEALAVSIVLERIETISTFET